MLLGHIQCGSEVGFAGRLSVADRVVVDSAPASSVDLSLKLKAKGFYPPTVGVVHAEGAGRGVEEVVLVEVVPQSLGRCPPRTAAQVESQELASVWGQFPDGFGGLTDFAIHVFIVVGAAVTGGMVGQLLVALPCDGFPLVPLLAECRASPAAGRIRTRIDHECPTEAVFTKDWNGLREVSGMGVVEANTQGSLPIVKPLADGCLEARGWINGKPFLLRRI